MDLLFFIGQNFFMKKIYLSCVVILFISCGAEKKGELEDGVGTGEHRLFVSSSGTNGNIGGITAADTICANLAKAAGLTRTYKSILSDSTSDASNRISISGSVYNFSSESDSIIIASSETAFWGTNSQNLSNAVTYDENYSSYSGNVWSGSTFSGSADFDHCNNWSSNSAAVDGNAGASSQKNDQWIDNTTSTCDSNLRIYCISQ